MAFYSTPLFFSLVVEMFSTLQQKTTTFDAFVGSFSTFPNYGIFFAVYSCLKLNYLGDVTRDSKTTIKLSKIEPTGTRDFNVENPSNKEDKKPWAPANKASLYRVMLQTPGIYNNELIPCGGLQDVFIVILT